jgi:hypothetical protein
MQKSKLSATVLSRDKIVNNEGEYEYTLSVVSDKEYEKTYEIEIRFRFGENKETVALASDKFESELAALSFYEKLKRNLATPIDLPYVLEDERA